MAKSCFKQEHDFGMCLFIYLICDEWLILVFFYFQTVSILEIWSLFSSEKRRAEAARIREKYPDRIPVRIKRISFLLQFNEQ